MRYPNTGIKQRGRAVEIEDLANLDVALAHLREARAALGRAGAKHAAAATRRALKSAEGARNHAYGRITRQAGTVFNHAYDFAFSVRSTDPMGCTDQEFLDGLKARIAYLEAHPTELRENNQPPIDTFEEER